MLLKYVYIILKIDFIKLLLLLFPLTVFPRRKSKESGIAKNKRWRKKV